MMKFLVRGDVSLRLAAPFSRFWSLKAESGRWIDVLDLCQLHEAYGYTRCTCMKDGELPFDEALIPELQIP